MDCVTCCWCLESEFVLACLDVLAVLALALDPESKKLSKKLSLGFLHSSRSSGSLLIVTTLEELVRGRVNLLQMNSLTFFNLLVLFAVDLQLDR